MKKELGNEKIQGFIPTTALTIAGVDVFVLFILSLPLLRDALEDRYEIKKDFTPKKSLIIKKPFTVKPDSYDIPIVDCKAEIKKLLYIFIERLKHCFSYQQLNVMFNNLQTLKISISYLNHEDRKRDSTTLGSYNVFKNVIILNKDNIKKTIFHELFHMTSNIFINKKESFCGFHYMKEIGNKKNISIGAGINEGYTQLLTERYFSDFDTLETYEIERFIASKVEEIIGQDTMEDLYFNGNLYELIEKLKAYATNEEIMKFLTMYDFIEYYDSYRKINKNLLHKLNYAYDYIETFLKKCYLIKLKKERKEKIITLEEYELKKEIFLRDLKFTTEESKKSSK